MTHRTERKWKKLNCTFFFGICSTNIHHTVAGKGDTIILWYLLKYQYNKYSIVYGILCHLMILSYLNFCNKLLSGFCCFFGFF